MARLSDDQRAFYQENGWLLVDDLLTCSIAELHQAVDAVAADDTLMQHHEMTDEGPRLARSEYFLDASPVLDDVLRGPAITEVASELMGEPVFLYKEKINYKHHGGAGFAPHQDQPAYPTVNEVLSVMVAVDDSTVANGCLEVVSARHQVVLEQDERGCIAPALVAELAWFPVELRAGQTLFFHGLTPHRSGANNSGASRRALYPTYNRQSEGDLREDYYRVKREIFAAIGDDGQSHISLIGDFEGRPV